MADSTRLARGTFAEAGSNAAWPGPAPAGVGFETVNSPTRSSPSRSPC